MPRNSSGIYTLPNAPFQSGTTISSTVMNSNLSDIAAALTGSMPTTGGVPFTGPIFFAAGSVTNPSITFSADQTSGFYLIGTGVIGLALDGILAATFNANSALLILAGGITAAGPISATGALSGASVTVTDAAQAASANITGGGVSLSTSKLMMSQCRLTLNGASLLLSPYQGNMLFINGVNVPIPSAGVSLTNSGLAASTFYYIYAFMNAGTMTLEASTTAKFTDTTTGWVEKTGDATRTLVGAVYTTAGSAFADTDGNRLVLNFFNRKLKSSYTVCTTNKSISSSTIAELDTACRNNFITWSDELVTLNYKLYVNVTTNVAAGTWVGAIAVDSTTTPIVASITVVGSAVTINSQSTQSATYCGGFSEGSTHQATLLALVSAGVVATFIASNCIIFLQIMG